MWGRYCPTLYRAQARLPDGVSGDDTRPTLYRAQARRSIRVVLQYTYVCGRHHAAFYIRVVYILTFTLQRSTIMQPISSKKQRETPSEGESAGGRVSCQHVSLPPALSPVSVCVSLKQYLYGAAVLLDKVM